jgi:bifunctional DNase/RNase
VVVPVRVGRVLGGQKAARCVVVLVAESAGMALPITVGRFEGLAIARALAGVASPRPLAHDLLVRVVDELGGRVVRVVVHDVRRNVFVAQIEVASRHGVQEIDCRPSDALAVAVRVGCDIYVEEAVLERAGVALGDVDEPG